MSIVLTGSALITTLFRRVSDRQSCNADYQTLNLIVARALRRLNHPLNVLSAHRIFFFCLTWICCLRGRPKMFYRCHDGSEHGDKVHLFTASLILHLSRSHISFRTINVMTCSPFQVKLNFHRGQHEPSGQYSCHKFFYKDVRHTWITWRSSVWRIVRILCYAQICSSISVFYVFQQFIYTAFERPGLKVYLLIVLISPILIFIVVFGSVGVIYRKYYLKIRTYRNLMFKTFFNSQSVI